MTAQTLAKGGGSGGRVAAIHLGRWAALASGTVAAVGLVLWFARFAFPGGRVGWLNDVLVMIQYALAPPIAAALHTLFRPLRPRLSLFALVIGIAGMLAVVVLQFLLVAGVLSFAQQVVPVSIAILVVGVWLVLTGYAGRATGLLPRGLLMGALAVPYFGYPIWALWLGRTLRPQLDPGLSGGARALPGGADA
jgi:hypothetical protein